MVFNRSCIHHRCPVAPFGPAILLSLFLAAALIGSPAQAQEPGVPAPEPVVGAAADPIPAAMSVQSCGRGGQVSRGFVAQTGLGGRLLTLAASDVDFSTGLQWNLLLGYKFCRVLIGLNLDLFVESPTGSSTVNTAFVLAPEVQIAMARSADGRAELIGAISAGVGSSGGNVHVSGKLAPGIRYWVHPHIALNTLVGFTGDLALHSKGQGALVSLFGTFGVLGAF